jgi:excisionase family DNA binding protein
MISEYVVRVELDRRGVSNDDVAHVHDHLGDWGARASENLAGYLEVTLTVPGNDLRQAVRTAMTLAAQLGLGEPIATHGASEALVRQRDGLMLMPALVSVPQAAEVLRCTRQNVVYLIETGKLPATKVSRDYVILEAALTQLRRDKLSSAERRVSRGGLRARARLEPRGNEPISREDRCL